MNSSLSALYALRVFPTGRRIFALQQVEARAKAAGLKDVSKQCAFAIAHDRVCLDLERRWEGLVADAAKRPPRVKGALDATVVDPLVDATLTAIRDQAVGQTRGAPADDPIHERVAGFLNAVFPSGLSAVTSARYVEELAMVDRIVSMLGDEQAEMVDELGLQRLTKRLAALAVDYRAALQAPVVSELTFAEVRAARNEGQQLLLETVVVVLAKHRTNVPADVAMRDHLLGPILEQNEAMGEELRGRRGKVGDVHPDHGTPTPTGPTVPPPGNA